jgi:hypothetical protein
MTRVLVSLAASARVLDALRASREHASAVFEPGLNLHGDDRRWEALQGLGFDWTDLYGRACIERAILWWDRENRGPLPRLFGDMADEVRLLPPTTWSFRIASSLGLAKPPVPEEQFFALEPAAVAEVTTAIEAMSDEDIVARYAASCSLLTDPRQRERTATPQVALTHVRKLLAVAVTARERGGCYLVSPG